MVFALFLLLAASPTFEESFRAGLLALQRNDLNGAATNLETAAKLVPTDGRVWVALAQTYWRLKETGKSDEAAAKAVTVAPADPVVLGALVMYYSESGRMLQAAEAQAKYAATVPNDPDARKKAESLYFEAVQPLLQQQKFAQAIAILGKARERLTNSAQLELALGVAYYGMRRFDDAASAFLRTITVAPDIEQPYVFLGKFLGQIPGRLPEVTRQFVHYQNANPASPTGYLLHAKALMAQSIEPENARKLLEKSISINDHDPSAHFELGVLLDQLQHYADAAREFETAARLDARDPATHYRLSRVYDRLGKPDQARKERELHAKLIEGQEAIR